jgi:hypothetical protein
MAVPKLPFGKHKGRRLTRVPTDYLVWCRDRCSTLPPELKAAVALELARREATSATPTSSGESVSPIGQSLAATIRTLFRNLALKYHPDRGGSPEAMRALNEFHEDVQGVVGRMFAS